MQVVNGIFSPLITVYSSEKANEIAAKNGFNSLAQLLEPFLNLKGKITTPTIQVEDFTARLASSNEGLALGVKTSLIQNVHDYRHSFLQVRVNSEHETFNHPIACLIVVSTADSDPMAEAYSLYNEAENRIKNLKLGYLKEELKLYILLHVASTGVNCDAIYSIFQKKTNLVHLIKLDCIQESLKDYWGSSVGNASIRAELSSLELSKPTLPAKLQKNLELTTSPLSNDPVFSDKKDLVEYDPALYGKNLSKNDILNIKTCMKDFVAYQVITYMGEKIIEWDRDVIIFKLIKDCCKQKRNFCKVVESGAKVF
jgi:hypothetical protein